MEYFAKIDDNFWFRDSLRTGGDVADSILLVAIKFEAKIHVAERNTLLRLRVTFG